MINNYEYQNISPTSWIIMLNHDGDDNNMENDSFCRLDQELIINH